NHHINEVNKTLLMSQIEIEEIHYFKQNLENYFTNLITTTEEER
ncbi:ABC transporter ATP-binding protein, partial [Lactococcus petauri]